MVAEYCDRIGVMYNGKMVEMGATETVFRHPQHEYTRSLLQAALHIQAVEDKEDGEKNSLNHPTTPPPHHPTTPSRKPDPLFCVL